MKIEKFRYLAGVIAAHQGGKVVGRARLQLTMRLLQRLGFPTEYRFALVQHEPHSEEVKSDVGLLEALGFAEEQRELDGNGDPRHVITANAQAGLEGEIREFLPHIAAMERTELVPLELAATYDSCIAADLGREEALERLRRKKGEKCGDGNLEKCFQLLEELGLLDSRPAPAPPPA